MIPGTWSEAAGWTLAFLIALGVGFVLRPRKRNKHVILPPPSAACKRNSTQAVTR